MQLKMPTVLPGNLLTAIVYRKKSSGKSKASTNLSRLMTSQPHKHSENQEDRKMFYPWNNVPYLI